MKDDSKDATKNKPQQLTQGEQLANAIAWILDKVSFDEIKLHGSVKWVVGHLVRVAILWVWSSKRLLVESANDAIEMTEEICGSIGGSFIGSYQVLTQASSDGASHISDGSRAVAGRTHCASNVESWLRNVS